MIKDIDTNAYHYRTIKILSSKHFIFEIKDRLVIY